MPYSFSEDCIQAVRNYLNNLGNLSELFMVRSWFENELTPQLRAKGLLPPVAGQTPPEPAPVPPVVDEVVTASVQQMTRTQRRLAKKANGKAPTGVAAPAQTPA